MNAVNDLFELFYKTPDCYLLDSGVLIYLYTPEYERRKSNIFRETLLEITSVLSGFPEVKVNWENDSIAAVKGSNTAIMGLIDPPFYEYMVYDGEIVRATEYFEMHYPDTGQPIGIPIDRFRQ